MTDPSKHTETIQLRQTPSDSIDFSPQPSQSQFLSTKVNTGDRRISRSQTLTSTTQQSQWWLRTQAVLWRFGMRIGMRIHDWAPPTPPRPSFHRYIQTTKPGSKDSDPIDLCFYCPPDYEKRKRNGHIFPVVVNYHGGGFVLGSPLDDRYWARVVLQECDAVVVSVGYRRAPEYPFPVPVDDCVDTLLYLSANSQELAIDTSHVVLSGFSAGANFTFAVPLRLKYHTQSFRRRGKSICINDAELSRFDSTKRLLASAAANELSIVGIVAWYPLVDFATTRDAKRQQSLKPEKTMPKFFTNLFDQSYLPGPAGINHASPYVSPASASDRMLRDGLPDSIQIFVCEYDMLLSEGQAFANRLRSLGKAASDTLVKGVPHAWDKSPNPFRKQMEIDQRYADACHTMKDLFQLPKLEPLEEAVSLE